MKKGQYNEAARWQGVIQKMDDFDKRREELLQKLGDSVSRKEYSEAGQLQTLVSALDCERKEHVMNASAMLAGKAVQAHQSDTKADANAPKNKQQELEHRLAKMVANRDYKGAARVLVV